MIQEGVKIEDFTLPDENGLPFSLSEYEGKKVVIYFYPKDNTPDCTREACSFRDEYDEILESGAEVIGISPDSPESHKKFKQQYNLPFKLLSDPGKRVIRLFDALGEKELIGKMADKIYRSTYILDEDMVIRKAFHKVKNPENHGREILSFLL